MAVPRLFRARLGLLWAVCVLAAVPSLAAAAPESTRVLVRIDSAASAAERAEVGRALNAVDDDPLAARWRVYELPGAVSLAEAKAQLGFTEAEDGVELDRRVLRPLAYPLEPLEAEQWGLESIGAQSTSLLPPAAPVAVAVLDTGVDIGHPDLAGSLWRNPGEIAANGVDDDGNGYVDDVHGWDFAAGDGSVYDDPNIDAHGTHVAGIIAATRNGSGIAGVAPNARIMTLKFVGSGGGLTSDAVTALRYARANGARVVNASFGGPPSQALCDAIAEAAAAGIVVVAAAGNEATNIDLSPRSPAGCAEPSLLSVAASTYDDLLAPFSNRGGGTVDLAAPGDGITSTVPGGGHAPWSGTSMAAPHVAGAAAALMGATGLPPQAIHDRLRASADPAPGLAGTVQTGARLNLARALGVTPAAPLAADADVAPATPRPRPAAVHTPRLLRLVARRTRLRQGGVVRLRYRVSSAGRVRVTVNRRGSRKVVHRLVRRAKRGENVLLLRTRARGRRGLTTGRYRIRMVPVGTSAGARSVNVLVSPRARRTRR